MLGYWEMPEKTAEALRDGWLHTGDLARLDEDGFLYIMGRAKDMIISGGENIYPAEIERVLKEHPGVRDVAVVGVPDREWGESVLAVVVPEEGRQPTPEEVVGWVRERLAGFKKPRFVEFVDALPVTTATGKVQKGELRRRYAGLAGG
jgi:acyl-CoA synthetase (AMP-forming)/AMP-acid ligase II